MYASVIVCFSSVDSMPATITCVYFSVSVHFKHYFSPLIRPMHTLYLASTHCLCLCVKQVSPSQKVKILWAKKFHCFLTLRFVHSCNANTKAIGLECVYMLHALLVQPNAVSSHLISSNFSVDTDQSMCSFCCIFGTCSVS